MRIHSREQIVSRARMDLTEKMMTWHNIYDGELTDAEQISIISGAFGDEISGIAKYMIRAERHPEDPGRPGGLE